MRERQLNVSHRRRSEIEESGGNCRLAVATSSRWDGRRGVGREDGGSGRGKRLAKPVADALEAHDVVVAEPMQILKTSRPRMASEQGWPVAVLVSGGIDSAALLAFYLRQRLNVRAMFVDFGQPAAKQESRAAMTICQHFGVPLSSITLKSESSFSPGEISGRNAFLVFAAVLVCRAVPGLIAIGIHEGSPYYDCGDGFLKSIQMVVDGYAAGRIRVVAPFLRWSKRDIWLFCQKSHVPVESTYSCERGGVPPCGGCLSCKDRDALNAL